MKSAGKFPRRNFLKKTGVALAGFAAISSTRAAGISGLYQRLSNSKYLGKVKTVARIYDDKVFTEGPAVDRAGNVYFTNVPMEKILKWSPRDKKLSVFRENSNLANGLLYDAKGRLLACEGGGGRVTRTDMATGKIEVLTSKFNGFPLAAPNDLELVGGSFFFQPPRHS